MNLDNTWVRMRAVRQMNIFLFTMGIILGFGSGFITAFIVWGMR